VLKFTGIHGCPSHLDPSGDPIDLHELAGCQNSGQGR